MLNILLANLFMVIECEIADLPQMQANLGFYIKISNLFQISNFTVEIIVLIKKSNKLTRFKTLII